MTDTTLPVARSGRMAESVASSPTDTRVGSVADPARWLLLAVAFDLVVTRIVVRLAIFVPKGEPWSTWSVWLGRLGALTDVLVLVGGLAVLVALLAGAGRGSLADRLLAVTTALIAASGFALLAMPPAPEVVVVVDLLIASVAISAVVAWHPAPAIPFLARLGIVALAGAVAAPPVARLAIDGLLAPAAPASWPVVLGTSITVAGQWSIVAGAVALGVAGLRAGGRSGLAVPPLVAGTIIAGSVIAAAVRAPTHADQIAIWSVGLTGVVPTPIVGIAAAVAVAGLPGLTRRTWPVAVGGAIVLLAGYGLAANGLVLASLVGLLVARLDRPPRPRLSEGHPR